MDNHKIVCIGQKCIRKFVHETAQQKLGSAEACLESGVVDSSEVAIGGIMQCHGAQDWLGFYWGLAVVLEMLFRSDDLMLVTSEGRDPASSVNLD